MTGSFTADDTDKISSTTNALTQRKLFEAAERGDSGMIRILALTGADLEDRNEDGMTPFALATRNNHADTAMTILALKEAQFMRRLTEGDDGLLNDGSLKKAG